MYQNHANVYFSAASAYEDYQSEIVFQIDGDVDLDAINLDEIDPEQSENAINNSTFLLYYG